MHPHDNMQTCMHMREHMHRPRRAHTRIAIHTSTHTHAHTHAHTYTYTYTYKFTCAFKEAGHYVGTVDGGVVAQNDVGYGRGNKGCNKRLCRGRLDDDAESAIQALS